MYQTITIKEKEYKLRLNTKACINIEKRLGTNPLNIFMIDDSIPDLGKLLVILHESLKVYHPDLTMDDVYTLYDDYCEDGGDISKFVDIIIDIFRSSGFLPSESETKNA